jgi:transposase-like protein
MACPARGQAGKGNIRILSQSEQRYECTVCATTFSATKGTPFYRCRTQQQTITQVVTLVTHGCPIPAISAAFGFQARTVRRWVEKAGEHCESVHHHLVTQPRDLQQVQADEIRVKTQRGIVWIAMAIAVPTRLWLGAVQSAHRNKDLIRALMMLVFCCALPKALLIVVDGFSAYVEVIKTTFRCPVQVHKRGRPRLVLWADLVIGQVIKHHKKRRLVEVIRKPVLGTPEPLEGLITASQGKGVLNTSFIERLNATFRSRLFALVRKTRCLARRGETLQWGVFLIGTVYNFCTFHDSLTSKEKTKRTPAMAAGITDHCWSVLELLSFRVPPERWQPPRRRGRRSKAMQALIQRWAT